MLKEKLLGFLFKLTRLCFIRRIIVYTLIHMNSHLPINRIYEDDHWIAFHHPQPMAPFHIVILLKRELKSLMELPNDEIHLISDLFRVVKKLVSEFDLEDFGYRLITNGGPYQTFLQWHWHLISEDYPSSPEKEVMDVM
jgi:histidine triad (HIT) family protein